MYWLKLSSAGCAGALDVEPSDGVTPTSVIGFVMNAVAVLVDGSGVMNIVATPQ